MKAWIGAALGAGLAALLGAPAATAAPPPGWHETPRSLHLGFSAKTDNGFLLALRTTGHRQVSLTLSKGNVLVTYRTAGRVSREGIEAKFGQLGEISVEFSGRPTPFRTLPAGLPPGALPRPDCRGRKPQQETGSFRGTIRFEGEGGFTRIDASRAKGTMTRAYRRLCKGRTGSPFGLLLRRAGAAAENQRKAGGLSLDLLIVAGHQGGRTVVFESFGISGSSGDPLLDELATVLGPLALVSTFEHRDGVRINRQARAIGQEGSLIVSPAKRERVTATVAFPKPLEGTAEFEHAPGAAPSWLGTLAARLPGAGPVPLTGEGLKPLLCRLPLSGSADELKKNPCFAEAKELLPATASGSLLAG